MKHNFYFKQLLFIALVVFYSSCDNSVKQEATSIKNIEVVKKKKTKKDHNKKKGIEIMAEYTANLMKPIGAEKSTYEDGFLMAEYQKAIKNPASSQKRSSSVLEFTERGPVNVPGRIRGIAVAPDDKDTWYVGTVGGGIWVTRDAGVTWENLTDFRVPSLSTSTVVVSANNPLTLYVGTGEPFGNLDAIGGIGVLKSTNAGSSWEYLNNTKDFGGIGRLAINPADENNLIVASENGIYVTTDGGLTWQNTYTGGNVQDLKQDPTNFSILYGGVDSIGIIKSTDGGLTWNLVFNKDDYNADHQRFEIDVSPANSNRIFAGVYTAGGAATTEVNTDLYVSNDAGATFTLVGYNGEPGTGNLITGQGWYDNVMMAHPYDENICYVGGVVMHKVVISGEEAALEYNFTPIAAGYNGELNDYVHVDQHGLAFIPETSQTSDNTFKLILANDGGIYATDYLTDPGTTLNDWSEAASGLNCTQFYGADKRNGVDDYTAGAQDNGTWISLTGDNATEETAYTYIIGGDGFEVLWNYDDPNKFIGGSQYNGFVGYENGAGYNARHGESGSGTSPFYSKIANANNNPDVVFSPSVSGVWRSIDFGRTWELTSIPDNFSVGTSSALDVSVSTANPDIVWAGNAMTESGSFVMQVSQDNGQSYAPTAVFTDESNPGSHNYFISGVETSLIDENRAYVLFSGQGAAKVLKTEDLGQTWVDISGFSTGEDRGFPDVSIHSLIEMPYDENILWVGTDIGVFQTLDGGLNWALLAGMPAVSVWQMKIVNDEVVMATHGRGVWTATIEELSGYEPPAYFAPPTIVSAFQEAIDNQNAVITYVQDSDDNIETINVFLDETEVDQITDNVATATEFSYVFENLPEGEHVVGFQLITTDGQESIVTSATIDIIDFNEPEATLSIDVFEPADVYTFGDEFLIDDIGATVGQAVLNNADHPYLDNTEYRTVLKQPITITSSSRVFTYEDVAITEFDATPGSFYDFVAVEASTDLANWTRLDTYDAERFTEWTDLFNSDPAPSINDDLFKEQTIDLLEFFNEGDVVAVRFRLVSDPVFNSFGWALRSVNLESPTLSIEDNELEVAGISIYPTISDGTINISSGAAINNASISVYALNGAQVFETKMDVASNSQQSINLGSLRKGMYLVNLEFDAQTETQKIIIK
ncbi:T9SS type A sorting domain-containing protein [Aquimarina addita]|uniref:T9SS type A sorting domain-containing protein n=1 Tax=Aquimarina addita TaxID=870485 RepID=A0ABP6US58_9FLAO